jgi:hypothetical protein
LLNRRNIAVRRRANWVGDEDDQTRWHSIRGTQIDHLRERALSAPEPQTDYRPASRLWCPVAPWLIVVNIEWPCFIRLGPQTLWDYLRSSAWAEDRHRAAGRGHGHPASSEAHGPKDNWCRGPNSHSNIALDMRSRRRDQWRATAVVTAAICEPAPDRESTGRARRTVGDGVPHAEPRRVIGARRRSDARSCRW